MQSMSDTIKGAVTSGLLDKADRLFRNDDAGIWVELLQNARRAGASSVEISIEETHAGVGLGEDGALRVRLPQDKYWEPASGEVVKEVLGRALSTEHKQAGSVSPSKATQ